MRDKAFENIYALALRSAKVRSAEALRAGNILAADRPDMQQDAVVRVFTASATYKAERAGLPTFIEVIVRSQCASFARSAYRWRRATAGSRRERPLDPIRATELRLDVRSGLSLLSVGERAVARGLMTDRPTEVARRLGLSRSTVYDRMSAIRRRFEAIGLSGKY